MYPLDDTIAAIASAPGGAARGIVRISGPNALECLERVFQAADEQILLAPTYPRVLDGSVHLSGMNSTVPCDLYLWPKGHSYTGQIVAELHTLGSPPLLEALLKSLCTSGARLAEPGEFTLRAFLSGRIDLTEAEAVLGVIDAADSHDLQVALAQLAGGLAGPLQELRNMLLEILAHLEAGFDFADEDLPFITADQLQCQLADAANKVDRLASQMKSRSSVHSALSAVLVGQPNTGKSSLFNALASRSRALVSDTPGTTRDYLVAEMDFDGRKCQLIDPAGFQSPLPPPAASSAMPEQAAQKAAMEQIGRAHVRLLCLDATRAIDQWEQAKLARADLSNQIVVWTKIDRLTAENDSISSAGLRRPLAALSLCKTSHQPAVFTSSITGEGLDQLREQIRRMILTLDTTQGDVVSSTAARCHESLDRAAECLLRARNLAQTRTYEEFIAAEIHVALNELGKVVGAVYADDVLERIFSRFCVGK
jgi:tRNA modification GTPase